MAEGRADSAYVRHPIDGVQPGPQPLLVAAVAGIHMAKKQPGAVAVVAIVVVVELELQCLIVNERQ